MEKAPEYSGALNNVFSILEQRFGVTACTIAWLSNNLGTLTALKSKSQVICIASKDLCLMTLFFFHGNLFPPSDTTQTRDENTKPEVLLTHHFHHLIILFKC